MVRLRWILALAVLLAVGLLALFLALRAEAQGPPVPPRAEVIEQRLRDLLDYRNYLEDQLAAAKAVITHQDAQLTACRGAQAPKPEPLP